MTVHSVTIFGSPSQSISLDPNSTSYAFTVARNAGNTRLTYSGPDANGASVSLDPVTGFVAEHSASKEFSITFHRVCPCAAESARTWIAKFWTPTMDEAEASSELSDPDDPGWNLRVTVKRKA